MFQGETSFSTNTLQDGKHAVERSALDIDMFMVPASHATLSLHTNSYHRYLPCYPRPPCALDRALMIIIWRILRGYTAGQSIYIEQSKSLRQRRSACQQKLLTDVPWVVCCFLSMYLDSVAQHSCATHSVRSQSK